MTINSEMTRLENTKVALKNAIIAGGGTITNQDSLADYVDALIDRFNHINNELITLLNGEIGNSPETAVLEQIKQVLVDNNISVTNDYSDLPTIIDNALS